MKTKLLSLAALFAAVQLAAAPLTQTTAVHTKPDAASPAITYLKAGAEPVAAPNAVASTPAGWMAVELSGPFEGYVEKKDMTKALDVKPGVAIRMKPSATAATLTVAERGDKTTISGVQGRWFQLNVEKPIVGYIQLGGAPGYLPPIATAAASGATAAGSTPASAAAPTNTAAAPIAAAPGLDSAPAPTTAPGQPVEVAPGSDSAMTLPRQFAGRFMSTRSALRPRRPYDWELVDNSGKRFAFLDLSKLLLTEQLDKYANHIVVVFGAAKPTADGKNLVIQVESLQLQLR